MFRVASRRLAVAGAGAISTGTFLGGLAWNDRKAAQSQSKPAKLKVGGVMGEYKSRPRCVKKVSPPRQGFFAKEMDVLGLPLRAHACVSDEALVVAADRLSRMLRYMPKSVMGRLERRGASFHVIGLCQGTTDLPEHAHMRGVDGGYTGETGITLDQRARGMGGVNSSCGEENLIDLDTDPRYAGRDMLTHEFAHCIMDVGLPASLRDEIRRVHARAVSSGCWTRPDGTRACARAHRSCDATLPCSDDALLPDRYDWPRDDALNSRSAQMLGRTPPSTLQSSPCGTLARVSVLAPARTALFLPAMPPAHHAAWAWACGFGLLPLIVRVRTCWTYRRR